MDGKIGLKQALKCIPKSKQSNGKREENMDNALRKRTLTPRMKVYRIIINGVNQPTTTDTVKQEYNLDISQQNIIVFILCCYALLWIVIEHNNIIHLEFKLSGP